MNYSRLKMRTGGNNDPACLEQLSLTGTAFFLPLLWALTLTGLFIIFQLKQAALVTSAAQDAFTLISVCFFLHILFPSFALSIESLEGPSCLPSTRASYRYSLLRRLFLFSTFCCESSSSPAQLSLKYICRAYFVSLSQPNALIFITSPSRERIEAKTQTLHRGAHSVAAPTKMQQK